jgi:large subunit ribosomal protein L9
MQYKLLLLEDVNRARKGEVIKVKAGFARNYLLPQKKGVVVDQRTLRMQEKLKEERAQQAEVDKVVSTKLSQEIEGKVFTTLVKVDPDGNMYGSVSAGDISTLLMQNGLDVNKKFVFLLHPIKTVGTHTVELHLKEGIKTSFKLVIESDSPILPKKVEKKEEKKEEVQEENA